MNHSNASVHRSHEHGREGKGPERRYDASGMARGFSLMELMAVVIIILVMIGAVSITLANSSPSMKVRTDAANMITFLRNMWDRTKTTGSPLILVPDFDKGSFSYADPRDGVVKQATFSSEARIIAIKLNDRLYSRASMDVPLEDDMDQEGVLYDTSIYVSEGRGLSSVGVIIGIAGEDDDNLEDYKHLTWCGLDLITGKGKRELLTTEDLEAIFVAAEEAEVQREMEQQ